MRSENELIDLLSRLRRVKATMEGLVPPGLSIKEAENVFFSLQVLRNSLEWVLGNDEPNVLEIVNNALPIIEQKLRDIGRIQEK